MKTTLCIGIGLCFLGEGVAMDYGVDTRTLKSHTPYWCSNESERELRQYSKSEPLVRTKEGGEQDTSTSGVEKEAMPLDQEDDRCAKGIENSTGGTEAAEVAKKAEEITCILNDLALMALSNAQTRDTQNEMSGNTIDAVIPKDINFDDTELERARERFCLLLGSVFQLISKDDQERLEKEIEEQENLFKDIQEKVFGVLSYDKLAPVYEPDALINPSLFELTGGVEEILETTPDKAFSQLKSPILRDFKMVAEFIEIANRIEIEEEAKERIENVKKQLYAFTNKWNYPDVKQYCTSDTEAKEAFQFIKEITNFIGQ